MASSGVNVLRYSALGLGVVYGFYHQRQIYSSDRAAAAQREYEHKQQLITQAKKAYAAKNKPAVSSSSASQDINSSSFDLESFIAQLDKA
ncbi:ATP synthase E chain-domain-containing protein [Triangularia verruculosa]|uniref:ATP synthase F(0) complex subunit e, mitochondrial n=1 Tax=Triangularia verruculosa TaxID=2587418 RepID=A0AAN6X875_9PEZI|nr:ATP synthase E chain-domain-containing protein [Triangularia verruculosa]